ncbi:TonB-dependent receptor domain-containing protein [Anaeromyxobacter oryzae]|uniref:Collagen-binding protein n=1 Tax=Anaeromyxobacter oryzae TaxID=2918170 RepID=A0ABM7WQ39_9BACT|nr:TonB-dependent receptor [Anaeromyxobacter oryzae]BDG01581.1 collagen-binding protein [Anaeromyxobacter oryzae]
MTRLPVALAALIAALAAAPARGADAAAGAGVLTRPPAVVQPAEPEYPEAARAEGITGQVTLELEISETGEVTDAIVTGPAGHGLDEAAVAAARRLRFSPAEIDGKPAAVRIEYRFTFALAPPPPEPAAPPEPLPVNFRGQVLERGTRLPVVAAQVQAAGWTVYTDAEGRFAIAGVPDGPVKVVVTDAAHARLEADEVIEPGKATEVRYWLRRTAAEEYEAVVVGEKEKNEVSHVAITAGEIRRVPGVSGDAVKVIQNLPGVARPIAGSGQLVIRGGNPRDTRVYVDGHEVPQIFHFGGLTSIYSSELIRDVEFEAGNFGVRYGRAIGGRVNLVTRDPGERTHALADANLYHATALVEGRPSEDVGVALAARRSYADAIITAAARQIENGPTVSVAPRYYDLQGKVAWHASPDDTLRLDVFGSDDRMVLAGIRTQGLRDISVLSYGTRFWATALRLDHRASEDTRVLVDLGAGWSQFATQVGDIFTDDETTVNGTLRAEVSHVVSDQLTIASGVDGNWYPRARIDVTAPPIPPPGEVPDPNAASRRVSETLDGYEAGAFVEATIKPVESVTIVPGVRADVHRSLATLRWVDPRIAARWQLGPDTALKGAAGLYHQAPLLVYLTKQWGNPDLGPERAWQYSVGAERRVAGRVFVDLQLYYKRLLDLALPSDATIVRDGQLVPERYRSAGTGSAYGAELLVRWDPDGRFFGWIAYSLSRSRRDQHVAGGRIQAEGDAFDQPSNLVAVGTWDLPEIWDGLAAGFRLRFTSGNPYEAVNAALYDADADRYTGLRTGTPTGRMPAFFQLDVRVDKKWTYRTWTFAAYLEVQNVTARKNPEGVTYNFDYTQRGYVTGLPLFPAFGLRAEY